MKKLLFLIFLFGLLLSCSEASQRGSEIDDVSDLRGLTVGVLLGSIQDTYATDSLAESTIMRIDDVPTLITTLKSGKCDAIIIDNDIANNSIRKDDDIQCAIDGLLRGDLGIGFNYNNPTLKAQFNQFLKEIKENGIYDEMCKRWFDDFDESITRMPEFELPVKGIPLRVGVGGISMPFEFYQDGKWEGFDMELMSRFSVYAQCPIEIFNINFGALIAALNSNKIDIISATLTNTPERAKKVAFSDPYFTGASGCYILKKGNKADSTTQPAVHGPKDLEGKTVSVMLGTVQDDFVTQNYTGINLLRLNNFSDILEALASGKCDAMIVDDMAAIVPLKNDANIQKAYQLPQKDEVGFGFNKNNPNLRLSFNRFLKKIKENGIYDEIHKRWIDDFDEKSTRMPDIAVPSSGEPVNVGISLCVPFEYVCNEEFYGFEVEIMRRFAAEINRPVTFHIYDFGSIIAALSAGKIDIISACLFKTPERAKQIDYSDSHYFGGSACYVYHRSPRDEQGKITGTNNLKECNLGVLLGSTHDIYATKNYPDARFFRFDDHVDLVLSLASGQTDAILEMEQSCVDILKAHSDFRVLDEVIFKDSVSVGINPDNPGLLQQFNLFLEQIRSDGTLQQMQHRWLSDSASGEMPTITLPTHGTPIIAGVQVGQSGFTYIRNNKITGFEPELLQRFAAHLGRPLQMQEMNFGALIPALISKKVDLIASTITVTPERAKKVLFSNQYYHINVVCIVKDAPQVTESSWWEDIKDSFYSNLILENRYQLLTEGLVETLIISFFSILLGTILGALICFMRMSNSKSLIITAKVYIDIMRGVPLLVFLMIMFYVAFASTSLSATIVAIITFAMNFAAYVSEMFRTSIEGVDKGQSEAGIALGFTKVKTFIYIVAPQAIRRVIPVFKGEAISLIKSTSIVGYIAIQDLTKMSDIIRSRTFDAFFPLIVISIIYFILAWLAGKGLDYLNKKTSSKKS